MGFAPVTIIDVGAYEGNWTRLVLNVFPDASVLMIEPQSTKRPRLERLCAEKPNVRLANALLGRKAGEATFYEMETGSSMFGERSNVARKETSLPVTTLNSLAGTLPGPIFLKIDVQGAELEVLEGAGDVLQRCEVVQLEVALLPYNEGAPTFLEVVSYMDARKFVPFDISGYSRPNGIDLAQIDMLFVRADSPLRRTFFEFPENGST